MVWSYEPSGQFFPVFLNTLHEDIAPLDSNSDRIKTTNLSDGIRNRTPFLDGLSDCKVLQFIIDESDDIAFGSVIERDKKRGDGLSFSLDVDKKRQEIEAFERAYNMSCLDKKLIHLNGRTPEEIWDMLE